MKPWTIYALKDPRTDEIRYVGWTIRTVEKRLAYHIWESREAQSHVHKWILNLQREGQKPTHEILEQGISDWATAEKAWIFRLRCSGCRLTNMTDGGEGAPGNVIPPETRAKMAEAQQRVREKLAASARNRRATATTRAKISKIMRNRSAETRAKISANSKAQWQKAKAAGKSRLTDQPYRRKAGGAVKGAEEI